MGSAQIEGPPTMIVHLTLPRPYDVPNPDFGYDSPSPDAYPVIRYTQALLMIAGDTVVTLNGSNGRFIPSEDRKKQGEWPCFHTIPLPFSALDPE